MNEEPMSEERNAEHVSRLEFNLRIRAMEWRLRFTIVLAVVAEVGLSRVGNDKLAAIGMGIIAAAGIGAKFLH